MAATTELELVRTELPHEVYAHSMSGIRAMGAVALSSVERVLEPEEESALHRGWNDFYTAVEENITTDPDFGERLIFEPLKMRQIVDGKVRTENGVSIFDLVKDGLEASRGAAKTNSDMETQVTRDEGDVLVAGWVDKLEVGEQLVVVSMDPKSAIKRNKKFWEEQMGYREGMAVVQTYYRASDRQMLTGVYAVKRSNKRAMAQVLQEYGITIDADTPDDLWTRYPIRKSGVSLEEAERSGQQIRRRHRELIGDSVCEYSTTQFMKENLGIVKSYFNSYLLPLSQATNSGRNNITMQVLSSTILRTADTLNPDVKQGLLRIANSQKFQEEDARLMESMIRYALVEELRKKLSAFVSRGSITSHTDTLVPRTEFSSSYIVFSAMDHQRNFDITMQMAKNIHNGVTAGRSYGGCTPSNPNGSTEVEQLSSIPSLQNIFGGKIENETSEGPVGKDGKGPLNFKCSKGHSNTRKDGEPLVAKCRVCKEDVGCAPSDSAKNHTADKSGTKLVPLLVKDYKKSERRQAA